MKTVRERGGALLKEGRFSEAAEVLREAVAQDSTDELAWRWLGAALGAAGDVEESIRAFSRAIALSPQSPKNHFNLAIALEKQGEFREAKARLHRALTLDPGYDPARWRLKQLVAA